MEWGALGNCRKRIQPWNASNGTTSKGGTIDEHDDDHAQGISVKNEIDWEIMEWRGDTPMSKNSLPLGLTLEGSIV